MNFLNNHLFEKIEDDESPSFREDLVILKRRKRNNMKIYHGTDLESAEKIKAKNILTGIKGPGICLTIETALNYSAIKCANLGKKRSEGCVVVIENIPSQILNTASKDVLDAFTLNDEFGNPSKGLPIQNVKILTIKEAQYWCAIEQKEFV